MLALALSSAVAVAQRPEPSPPAERARLEPAALERIKAIAVPFRADVPTQAELGPLMEKIASARVIGIGESTHGDLQSQTFKGHLIRELVRKGSIDTVIFEINRGAGAQIDAYVNEGKGELADVLLNGGIFSIWRTDEMASLLGWLRAYVQNTGKPVRVYGVDCQDPAVDLELAADFLEKTDRQAARRLRETFAQLFQFEKEKKSYYAWVKAQKKDGFPPYSKAIQDVEALFEKNKQSWKNRAGFDEAKYALRTAWQALHAFEFDFGPGQVDFTKVSPADFARRDLYMGANTITRIGAERRAAIWAHDGHVLPVIASPYKEMGFATLGSAVKDVLGDQYFSIGFTWSRGAIHAKPVSSTNPNILAAQQAAFEVVPLVADQPGDLGEFLGRVGHDRFYFDLRPSTPELAAWGKLPYYVPSVGFAIDPAMWLNQADQAYPMVPTFDVLVYSRVISPSTIWNVPKKTSK